MHVRTCRLVRAKERCLYAFTMRSLTFTFNIRDNCIFAIFVPGINFLKNLALFLKREVFKSKTAHAHEAHSNKSLTLPSSSFWSSSQHPDHAKKNYINTVKVTQTHGNSCWLWKSWETASHSHDVWMIRNDILTVLLCVNDLHLSTSIWLIYHDVVWSTSNLNLLLCELRDLSEISCTQPLIPRGQHRTSSPAWRKQYRNLSSYRLQQISYIYTLRCTVHLFVCKNMYAYM